jgi:hypothetical protein
MAKGLTPAQAKESRKATKIVSCTCKHEYQDTKYGKGKRVANLSEKHGFYRCTVCSSKY